MPDESLLPVIGKVSPANTLWIADQVRNDKLLLGVLNSYSKSVKKPSQEGFLVKSAKVAGYLTA